MLNTTEKQNPISINIDSLSIIEILRLINKEDQIVPSKVGSKIYLLEKLINEIITRMDSGGRLFYVGCGTSGRLGVLDAAECPPTFSTDKNLVNGIIAGGNKALVKSIESAEDSEKDGRLSIIKNKISKKDIVIGISASSLAPFVHGALKEAYEVNALTSMICCNEIKREQYMKHLIPIVVGSEVISGSTRMKAGTATKLVLNMISTTTMIKMNKTYGNYMVDLTISNSKLLDRGIRIISELTSENYLNSKKILLNANGKVKNALLMTLSNIDYNRSEKILDKVSGNLREALLLASSKK